jgi:hypothetical protein
MLHTIYYHVQNGGDGSASPRFFSSETLAEWANERDEERFCDSVGSLTIEADGPIKIAKLQTPESYFVQLVDEEDSDVLAEFAAEFFPDGIPHFTACVVELHGEYHRVEVYANGAPVSRVFCRASRSPEAIVAELNMSAARGPQ